MREHKRMIRLLVADVALTKTEQIIVGVVLRGGQNHQLTLAKPLNCWELRQTDPAVIAALDELLEEHTDAQAAEILNARGLASGTGGPFIRLIVIHLRRAYHLRSRRQRLIDAGLLTVSELARHLGIHYQTVKHRCRDGIITGVLANDKGEYLYPIPGPELARPIIGRPRRDRPRTPTLRNNPMRCSVMATVSLPDREDDTSRSWWRAGLRTPRTRMSAGLVRRRPRCPRAGVSGPHPTRTAAASVRRSGRRSASSS
ncbi:hypothetical protein [Streptomyces sp. NPDC058572]|uniref:hypothetical protein n=1 Tax=Streptomyces sp. NPDC058572 TaxID=3346546 RepID=UPI003662015B